MATDATDASLDGANRNASTHKTDESFLNTGLGGWNHDVTKGTSKYEGWGTNLKPSHEPIVLARKPFKGSVVDNVIKYGTGGINIDKSRVAPTKENYKASGSTSATWKELGHAQVDDLKAKQEEQLKKSQEEGRFPANFIHDGSDEVLEGFPDTVAPSKRLKDYTKQYSQDTTGIGQPGGKFNSASVHPDGGGSAARFFYCAKVGKKERNAGLGHIGKTELTGRDPGQDKLNSPQKLRPTTQANNHPTVKPVKLMTYLVNLVTPEGGIVLDPFMGSGSTGMACKQEGFSFIGIDLDEDYVNIAKARIEGHNK